MRKNLPYLTLLPSLIIFNVKEGHPVNRRERFCVSAKGYPCTNMCRYIHVHSCVSTCTCTQIQVYAYIHMCMHGYIKCLLAQRAQEFDIWHCLAWEF